MPAVRARGSVLAFDFGARRIGVAVGDIELGIAHALEPIEVKSADEALEAIAKLVSEWQPVVLVVGDPAGEAGSSAAETARAARRFAHRLEARFKLRIAHVDERYSSTEAHARLSAGAGARHAAKASRERKLDSRAAQVILEQYFRDAERAP